jgi:hypothetical protein
LKTNGMSIFWREEVYCISKKLGDPTPSMPTHFHSFLLEKNAYLVLKQKKSKNIKVISNDKLKILEHFRNSGSFVRNKKS